MKPVKYLIPFLFLFIFIVACEYDGPTKVWNKDDNGGVAPVISKVEPPLEALAGYTLIKITGENFSADTSQIKVYFGSSSSSKGELISASATEILVRPPNIIEDSLSINVVTRDAHTTAKYFPYRLKGTNIEYSDFGTLNVLAMSADANENVYVALANRSIMKIQPDGAKINYGTVTFDVTCLRMGPGENLFIQKENDPATYTIQPGGGDPVEYSRHPTRKKVAFFDFDKYFNIYIGGIKTGLFVMTEPNVYRLVGLYHMGSIQSVRVFNDYVYVIVTDNSTEPRNAIWKNAILDETGNLGAAELVLDLSATGDYATSQFYDITFAQNGDMYIATDNVNPILILQANGTMTPLFAGLINGPANGIVWGNSKYLYMHRGINQEFANVSRIELEVTGAPYYGR
ncbi:MAG TPA: IPT/TIG domain-containing protein [bacterium]|nr:IPT/TIG domain-containing protein [bacterium]HPN43453.1 IPT/TIG domain-containing protein [bacterium]